MRTGISIDVTAYDRQRLAAIVADRNSLQKHVWRANIVLLTADGCGTAEIMRGAGSPLHGRGCRQPAARQDPAVAHPAAYGRGRRQGGLPYPGSGGRRNDPLDGSGDAKASGISVSSVQRIWRRHGLQPDRIRQFKLSNDPNFAAKLRAVVGLYINPPGHAVVLSIGEKSQIQALHRTQPGLP
jgi:hypothetical protein